MKNFIRIFIMKEFIRIIRFYKNIMKDFVRFYKNFIRNKLAFKRHDQELE